MYIYIYIYVCVCVCVYMYIYVYMYTAVQSEKVYFDKKLKIVDFLFFT